MSFKVRTATPDDFQAMYEVDYAANANHPVYNIPFKNPGLEGVKAFCMSRYNFLYHSRNPEYVFLVATAEDQVVGYLFYRKPPGEGEVESWSPKYVEGTDLQFFKYLWGRFAEEGKRFEADLKGCWELDGFAVHANWQRKGIGSMLIKKFLEPVDAIHAPSEVGASRIGIPLYEKFGFKVLGECVIDLKEYSDETLDGVDGKVAFYPEYKTFSMKREAV